MPFQRIKNILNETGETARFTGRFFHELFKPRLEFSELIRQCFYVGYMSIALVSVTAFIMGLVITIQSRPTLVDFGAEAWLPKMVSVSLIREIAPVITALICAGKVGSGIGAELGSMKVTEQIDAMEVSGTNPFKYLVVTRVLATTLMVPLLAILADAVSLYGGYLGANIQGDISWDLFWAQVFETLQYNDVIPAVVKTFFFGFAIGIIGCYKGFNSKKGTEGVGQSANSAVVIASLLVFIIDLIAVQLTDLFRINLINHMTPVGENILTNEPVIKIENLNISFGSNHVLRNLSLSITKGENVAVLGKSGSGKSVLIKCIIGLIKPDTGNIQVLNQSITELSSEDLDRVRMKTGFLFQSNALYDSMTVRENLEFPLRRHGIEKSKTEVDDMVKEALTNVGLPDTENMMPAELSGGMKKKRIALARTLILKPEIILYDEPTTGLDPITGKEISNLMIDVQKKYNTSSIIISHDIYCVKIVANRILMLFDGYCYADGTYEELKNSKDKIIKSFFE